MLVTGHKRTARTHSHTPYAIRHTPYAIRRGIQGPSLHHGVQEHITHFIKLVQMPVLCQKCHIFAELDLYIFNIEMYVPKFLFIIFSMFKMYFLGGRYICMIKSESPMLHSLDSRSHLYGTPCIFLQLNYGYRCYISLYKRD
jgi:hypothetical protein